MRLRSDGVDCTELLHQDERRDRVRASILAKSPSLTIFFCLMDASAWFVLLSVVFLISACMERPSSRRLRRGKGFVRLFMESWRHVDCCPSLRGEGLKLHLPCLTWCMQLVRASVCAAISKFWGDVRRSNVCAKFLEWAIECWKQKTRHMPGLHSYGAGERT